MNNGHKEPPIFESPPVLRPQHDTQLASLLQFEDPVMPRTGAIGDALRLCATFATDAEHMVRTMRWLSPRFPRCGVPGTVSPCSEESVCSRTNARRRGRCLRLARYSDTMTAAAVAIAPTTCA